MGEKTAASSEKTRAETGGRTSPPLPAPPGLDREVVSLLGNQTAGRLLRSSLGIVQPKLRIGSPGDVYEQEADRVADAVIGGSAGPVSISAVSGAVQRRCANCQGECRCHEEEGTVRPKENPGGTSPVTAAFEPRVNALRGRGEPLPTSARSFFEPRFGHDFGAVRVHTGTTAHDAAQAVNARAFTIGNDVVFGAGEYSPGTSSGRHLLAHELTHVVQQGQKKNNFSFLQRAGMGDVRLSEACDALIKKIRATPAFKALSPSDLALAEEIITEINKRQPANRHYLLRKLKLLFKTPERAESVVSSETKKRTAKAVTRESARLAFEAKKGTVKAVVPESAGPAQPAVAISTLIEEKGAKDPSRTWTPIKGKFGGGTYYVDRKSPTNIAIKAKILLKPAGTGTVKDVQSIKAVEDAIEKAASTKGYLVDIQFVDTADADTFSVDVNPSKWQTATNWSGGEPRGFAHELHHMFAFELDRYNYIEAHSDNESMKVSKRLIWFKKELGKPANYNDPTSIMDSAEHPNDSDVCTVAGLDLASCIKARSSATVPKK